MAVAKKKDEEVEIETIMTEAWETSGENMDAALIYLQKNKWPAHVLDTVVRQGWRNYLRKHLHGQRRNVIRLYQNPKSENPFEPERGTEGLIAMAESTWRSLMEFPVWGGKQLGECTKEEVQTAANKFYAVSLTMSKRGRFLAIVAQKVPDGKTVKESLKDDDLEYAMLEAERGGND